MEQIGIELIRAPDDPPAHDPQFQEELREFARWLRQAGVSYSQRGAVGYALPEFWVTVSAELGATFATILTTWLQNQSGRAIRATLDNDVVDLESMEDVEGLIARFQRRQEKPSARDGER